MGVTIRKRYDHAPQLSGEIVGLSYGGVLTSRGPGHSREDEGVPDIQERAGALRFLAI